MIAIKSQILSVVLLAVASVHAQSTTESGSAPLPTSTGTISACIIGCVQPAATANGCDFTDAKCVCASAQFQADARSCLESTCTPEDLATAEALQQSQCATAGVTPTGSATTPAATGSDAGNSTAVPVPTANTTTTGTSAKPTVTSPTGASNTTTKPTGTTNGTAPGASTTNAAVGMKGVGMGALAGVAALVGLVL